MGPKDKKIARELSNEEMVFSKVLVKSATNRSDSSTITQVSDAFVNLKTQKSLIFHKKTLKEDLQSKVIELTKY